MQGHLSVPPCSSSRVVGGTGLVSSALLLSVSRKTRKIGFAGWSAQ